MQQGMTAESAAPYLVDQAATQPQQRPRHPACPRLLHIGPTTFRVTCCLWTEPQQHTSRALLHIGHLALCSHWQQPGGPCINLLASTNLHQPTCINHLDWTFCLTRDHNICWSTAGRQGLTWQELISQQVVQQRAPLGFQQATEEDGQLRICQLVCAHSYRILQLPRCTQ